VALGCALVVEGFAHRRNGFSEFLMTAGWIVTTFFLSLAAASGSVMDALSAWRQMIPSSPKLQSESRSVF
jgi:hypothetical protein